MLTTNTLIKANELNDVIKFANKKLSLVPGSHIGELVSTLKSFNETGSDESIINQSVIPGSTTGTHSEIEDRIVNKLSKIMGNIINAAKNEVNPHCRAIIDLIDLHRKERALESIGLLGSIEQVEMPKLFLNEMFIELISPYKDNNIEVIKNIDGFMKPLKEDFSLEEIRMLLTTDSAGLDTQANDYINLTLSDLDMYSFDYYTINPADYDIPRAVLLFLVLTGLINEKLDKASAIMANGVNKLAILELRGAMAGKIYRYIEQLDNAIKNGEIISRDTKSNVLKIYKVNGVNYRKWINENGGSPEAVLGYFATNMNIFSTHGDLSLRNEPAKYCDLYTNRINHLKTVDLIDDVATVRKTTRDYMTNLFSQLTDINKTEYHNRLSTVMDSEFHHANNLHHYVIKVVSLTLTNSKDVCNFLLNIDNILSEMDTPNMKYAVYIACIRLIAGWITTQFKLERL